MMLVRLPRIRLIGQADAAHKLRRLERSRRAMPFSCRKIECSVRITFSALRQALRTQFALLIVLGQLNAETCNP
jgi:hypothetical protein